MIDKKKTWGGDNQQQINHCLYCPFSECFNCHSMTQAEFKRLVKREGVENAKNIRRP